MYVVQGLCIILQQGQSRGGEWPLIGKIRPSAGPKDQRDLKIDDILVH